MQNDGYSDEWLDDHEAPDEEDIEQIDQSIKFRDFVRICSKCKMTVEEQMDSCPYCGDILFDYFRDGTFAPRRGPLTKLFAVLVILLVAISLVMLLLITVGPL